MASRIRNPHGDSFRPPTIGAGLERESLLHKQAIGLLSALDYPSIVRSQNKATPADNPTNLELTKGEKSTALTEADCRLASENKNMLKQFDLDQVTQVVSTNPTSESMVALVDRDMSRAIDMCLKRADIRAIAEHNDDLPQSFHRALNLATRGIEG